MIQRIKQWLGLTPDVGGAMHVGANPVYVTYVYENPNGTYAFAWHDSKHVTGSVSNPVSSKEDAITLRDTWEWHKALSENASFIRG